MRIRTRDPIFTVVGSADDKDVTTGPGKSYGPENQPSDSVTDGTSQATSTCTEATKLIVEAIAQTGQNSASSAYANAKAVAKSTLVISYSLLERILAWFGVQQEMDMQVVVRLHASVNDGPCGAGFSVFILNGPGGVNLVPSWTGLYSCSRNAGDGTKLDVTRANGVVETIPNGGKLTDWPDGPTVAVTPGKYDLTFEVNAVATADGTVSILQKSDLVLQPH